MTTKTVMVWIAYLTVVVGMGQLISPWLALGWMAGSLLGMWAYYRGSDALDETQATAYWWLHHGWQDSPPGEDRPYLSEIASLLLLLIVLSAALVITIASL